MTIEGHAAAMKAPLRNVTTEEGGAQVDRGFVVWMDKDRYQYTYIGDDEEIGQPWPAALLCLGVSLVVVLALTWLVYF